jgi:DeoR/GlpR family transcriptional regulator of sugar metabolism
MIEIDKKQSLLLNVERDEKILTLLASQGPLRVSDLSGALGVSEPTVRRDLVRLG